MASTRDPMASRVAFFYEHAGYGYDPARETAEQGRQRCAEELARAEELAASRGWYVDTQTDWDVPDDDADSRGLVERGEMVNLLVTLRDEDGQMLACLGAVTVPSDDDPYIRVCGAELASDVLSTHQECRARTTCGGCGHAWCGVCDPAPSALCHWCNGRGWSDAELAAEELADNA